MSDEYPIIDLANWYYEDKTLAPIQGICSKSKHIFYGVVFCDLIFINDLPRLWGGVLIQSSL